MLRVTETATANGHPDRAPADHGLPVAQRHQLPVFAGERFAGARHRERPAGRCTTSANGWASMPPSSRGRFAGVFRVHRRHSRQHGHPGGGHPVAPRGVTPTHAHHAAHAHDHRSAQRGRHVVVAYPATVAAEIVDMLQPAVQAGWRLVPVDKPFDISHTISPARCSPVPDQHGGQHRSRAGGPPRPHPRLARHPRVAGPRPRCRAGHRPAVRHQRQGAARPLGHPPSSACTGWRIGWPAKPPWATTLLLERECTHASLAVAAVSGAQCTARPMASRGAVAQGRPRVLGGIARRRCPHALHAVREVRPAHGRAPGQQVAAARAGLHHERGERVGAQPGAPPRTGWRRSRRPTRRSAVSVTRSGTAPTPARTRSPSPRPTPSCSSRRRCSCREVPCRSHRLPSTPRGVSMHAAVTPTTCRRWANSPVRPTLSPGSPKPTWSSDVRYVCPACCNVPSSNSSFTPTAPTGGPVARVERGQHRFRPALADRLRVVVQQQQVAATGMRCAEVHRQRRS